VIEIRDPVHGFIELHDDEAEIVDTQVFQRLRRVHQLAMAYLVYPGATHTRFDHSLGVRHVAACIGERLDLREDELRSLRLAALLHDVGHGPFSHVSEYVLAQVNRAVARERGIEEVHEAIGMEIIRGTLFEGERTLTASDVEGIEGILMGVPGEQPNSGKMRNIRRDIVSGPLDADKLDYLLRDSHYAGVQYGVYDLQRLMQSFRPVDDPDGVQSYLAVAEEDVPAVDQYIIALHNMRGQVYRHRVRRIADAMLQRAILLSIEDGNKEARRLYEYRPQDTAYLQRYLECDDYELTRLILAGPDGPGKQLMARLRDRRLAKEVFREPLDECGDEFFAEIVHKKYQRREGFADLEGEIANRCSLRSASVFVDFLPGKTIRGNEPGVDPEEITVVAEGGQRKAYDDVSDLFRHRIPLAVRDRLCVYVLVDEADQESQQALSRKMRERVKEAIAEYGAENEGMRKESQDDSAANRKP